MAETTAREMGRVSLVEALQLTALIARKDPRRHQRVAARWLVRYLEEHSRATISESVFVASALAALGGPAQDDAYATLLDMTEAGSRRAERARIA